MNEAKKIWLIRFVLGVIYLVGFIGIWHEKSRGYFLPITPYTLLLSSILLVPFHKGTKNIKAFLLYVAIFMLGLLVEIMGVNTGLIFGEYHYGKTLGVQLFNTPIIIGLNWLMLVYTSGVLLNRLKLSGFLLPIAAALLMVFYDYFLEAVAHKLDMWHWHAAKVPAQNYIAWFVIALAFQFMLKYGNIRASNALASTVFIAQLVFFILLTIFI